MAWPSSKASTTNVDAGTDLVKNARADIKQNIDNVNAIIDEFDIASPSNGDLLQYNSTSGAWETVTQDSISSLAIAILSVISGEQLVSGNTYKRAVSENFDPNSILTVSTYTFTLPAGNYIMQVDANASDDEASSVVYNDTDDIQIGGIASYNEIGTTAEGPYKGMSGFTLAASKTLSIRQTTANSGNRNATYNIKITKF